MPEFKTVITRAALVAGTAVVISMLGLDRYIMGAMKEVVPFEYISYGVLFGTVASADIAYSYIVPAIYA